MPDGQGPYLIIAALWQVTDTTDEVAAAIPNARFPAPPGYSRGAVVSFRHEVADKWDFQRDLERFNLAELNARPDDGR